MSNPVSDAAPVAPKRNWKGFFRSRKDKKPDEECTNFSSPESSQGALTKKKRPISEHIFSPFLKRNRSQSDASTRTTPPGPRPARPRLFGLSLAAATKQSCLPYVLKDGDRAPTERYLPTIVFLCFQCLLLYGLNTTGIFRTSGSRRRIALLQDAFESGRISDLSELQPMTEEGPTRPGGLQFTVGDLATLVKRYLRQLPTPPLSARATRAIHKIITDTAVTDREKGVLIRDELERLAPDASDLVVFLVGVLGQFASNMNTNCMEPQALATVFLPGLMEPRTDSFDKSFHNMCQVTLCYLLTHARTIVREQIELPYVI